MIEHQSGRGKNIGHPANNTSHLHDERNVHAQPEPEQPADDEPRSRNAVHGFERRLAGDDGVTTEFDLHKNLDEATEDDEPQQGEADFAGDLRGSYHFARTDDGGSNNQAGADTAKDGGPMTWSGLCGGGS